MPVMHSFNEGCRVQTDSEKGWHRVSRSKLFAPYLTGKGAEGFSYGLFYL